MRPEFILQVDADLSRLACSAMVGGDAAADALKAGLRQLAGVLATAPFEGLAIVIDTMMRAADVAAFVRSGRVGTMHYRFVRTVADMRYACLAARDRLQWSPRVSLAEGLARVLARMEEPPYPY